MKNRLVKECIHKAEEDYESAKILVKKRTKRVPDVVCFHSQQCIEKYLKAFLTQNKIEPPAIHDLQRLNAVCLKVDKGFSQISDALDVLNAYAVVFRYPGEGATVRESKDAFLIASKIRNILKSKIKQ